MSPFQRLMASRQLEDLFNPLGLSKVLQVMADHE